MKPDPSALARTLVYQAFAATLVAAVLQGLLMGMGVPWGLASWLPTLASLTTVYLQYRYVLAWLRRTTQQP